MRNRRCPTLSTRRRLAAWSVPLLAVILSLSMYAPDALACAPYVSGDVQCPDTGAAVNVPVAIWVSGSTYHTTTDELGHFSFCVGCVFGCSVAVTVGGETRTLWVTGNTYFGTWVFDASADGDDTTYCGCQPRVSGIILCPDGETLGGKTATIYQAESGSCPSRTYYATSDPWGFFYRCVCDESWVTVSVDADARTEFVTEHTHFGTYISDINADGDPYSVCDGDCNDYSRRVYPGATEWCDDIDNDCDHQVDEGCIEIIKPGGSPVFRKPIPVIQPGEEMP